MAFAGVVFCKLHVVTDTRAHALDRTRGYCVSRLWLVCTDCTRNYYQTVLHLMILMLMLVHCYVKSTLTRLLLHRHAVMICKLVSS